MAKSGLARYLIYGNKNITQEQLIEGNDKFKEGTTTKEYRAVRSLLRKHGNATTGKEVKDLVKASKKF